MNDTLEQELKTGLGEIKAGIEKTGKDIAKHATDLTKATGDIQAASDKIKSLETEKDKLRADLDQVRRQLALRGPTGLRQRRPGFVSDEFARELAAAFIIGNLKAGRLDDMNGAVRDALYAKSKEILGIEQKATLTTSDIALPQVDTSELLILIAEYGIARRTLTPFPIPAGTVRPRRLGTLPTFGSIAQAAAFSEKSPTLSYATLESHKVGGIVRYPREIDEQSVVPLGQFLARYGAIEFARAEDQWAFLADGTATYESVKGITKVCSDLSKVTQLAGGKTAPSDAVLDDFRKMRRLVNTRVLSTGRYYMNATWESYLRSFNTLATPNIYVHNGPGGPTLDGFPITWVEVLTPYGTAASVSSYLAVFGDLKYWWMGEHRTPRVDFSADVYFATDELATRFIEEIDFDYAAPDAVSALETAAA